MAVPERFLQCVRKISPGDEVWNLRGLQERPGNKWHALAVCPCEQMYADVEIEGEPEQRTVGGLELKDGQLVTIKKPVWVGRVGRIIEFNGKCLGEESQLIQ